MISPVTSPAVRSPCRLPEYRVQFQAERGAVEEKERRLKQAAEMQERAIDALLTCTACNRFHI
jgi:hypothetical protein